MSGLSHPAQPQPFKIYFKHRFDAAKAGDQAEFIDALFVATQRSKGVLRVLYALIDQADGLAVQAGIGNASILGALDSVIASIDDMNSILEAHLDAVNAGGPE